MSAAEDRLLALGLALPEVVPPVAAYVPAVRSGNLVWTSGQLPMADGKLMAEGLVGSDVDPEAAKDLAQRCALNALAAIKAEIGDLDSVELTREVWRAHDDELRRLERTSRLDHPVDQPPTEQRVEMLRRRRAHPRAEPSCEDDGCQQRGNQAQPHDSLLAHCGAHLLDPRPALAQDGGLVKGQDLPIAHEHFAVDDRRLHVIAPRDVDQV